MIPRGLDHIAIGVSDLASSVNWYQDVIGLDPVTKTEWGAVPIMMLTSNGSGLALFPSGTNIQDPGRNLPHIAFRITESEYNNYMELFKRKGLTFSEEDHIISRSLFLRDPDQYHVELTYYL